MTAEMGVRNPCVVRAKKHHKKGNGGEMRTEQREARWMQQHTAPCVALEQEEQENNITKFKSAGVHFLTLE